MNGRQRLINGRSALAAFLTIVVLFIEICSELVGFNKLHPAASPKTFDEVVTEWPMLLGKSIFILAVCWLWFASQKKRTLFVVVF